MELRTLTALCTLIGTLTVSLFLLVTRPGLNMFGAVVTKQQIMDLGYDVLAELESESEGLLGGDNHHWRLHKLGGSASCLDGSPAGTDKFLIQNLKFIIPPIRPTTLFPVPSILYVKFFSTLFYPLLLSSSLFSDHILSFFFTY